MLRPDFVDVLPADMRQSFLKQERAAVCDQLLALLRAGLLSVQKSSTLHGRLFKLFSVLAAVAWPLVATWMLLHTSAASAELA